MNASGLIEYYSVSKNNNEQLNIHYNKLNTLVIDTRFSILIDESIYCSEEYINYVLQYIVEHREQVRNILEGVFAE